MSKKSSLSLSLSLFYIVTYAKRSEQHDINFKLYRTQTEKYITYIFIQHTVYSILFSQQYVGDAGV